MKYEFNVGDYVETVDGRVGYISDLWSENENCRLKRYIKIGFTNKSKMMCEYTDSGCYWNTYILFQDYFKRIGKYDFAQTTQTEKKNKIEPLSEPENVLGVNIYCSDELARKINEIIDYINRQEINK